MGKTPRLVDNGDNTITDTKTGLQWIKDPLVLGGEFAKKMDYKEAEQECKKLNAGKKKDWRLPTREELLSIVDLTRMSPAIDPIFANTISSWYWTSIPIAGYSSDVWCVYFYAGGVNGYGKNLTSYVRPVRSSQ